MMGAETLILLGCIACLLGSLRFLYRAGKVLAECVRQRRVVEHINDEIWKRLDGADTPGL